jgi:Domain of unknown function (DUF222)
MRSGSGESSLESVLTDLAELAAGDVVSWSDEQVRTALPALLSAVNQLNAVVAGVVGSFDVRDLSEVDGCRTTRTWLTAFGRMSQGAASGWLSRARLMRELPALAAAAGRGDVSAEHLRKVNDLVEKVGVVAVRDFDEILAGLASTANPIHLEKACERIRAHVDPDGPAPDPHAAFERRGFTLSRSGSMFAVRGQFDAEGGAALTTALDALMKPPGADDTRTPAQRRADAMVELARIALTAGYLPTIGGVRPQLGLLITPKALLASSDDNRPSNRPDGNDDNGSSTGLGGSGDNGSSTGLGGIGVSTGLGGNGGSGVSTGLGGNGGSGGSTGPGDRPGRGTGNDTVPAHGADQTDPCYRSAAPGGAGPWTSSGADPLSQAGVPPLPDLPWMNWVGDIPTELAQRIACDCEVWRAVLDPSTGLPLEVGRAHRIVPHWIRKALHARDRGCRWPGCDAPAAWTDAHHLLDWYYGGETNIDNLLSLCRYHHARVHEGHWRIVLDHATGEVRVFRPDGTPYELGPTLPWIGPNTHRGDTQPWATSPKAA